jgi:hypothetical protein
MATKVDQSFVEHRIGQSSLANSNAKVLQIMCNSRGLSVEGYRADLAARLVEWVFRSSPDLEGSANVTLKRESNIACPVELSPREVLGRDILEAVWDDMARTELPSWMSPAPRNWETATRGKLTADQWKVVATVHLPVTLIRLWGAKQGRHFLMLCNFMDLSAAIQLANQRIITERHIVDYERLILRYLQGMKILFKDAPLQPIHHVSMHAGEFLRLFGPTHSVRTPGFERFNERLGLQNTNMKSGESL